MLAQKLTFKWKNGLKIIIVQINLKKNLRSSHAGIAAVS